jgi:hypothetical protein
MLSGRINECYGDFSPTDVACEGRYASRESDQTAELGSPGGHWQADAPEKVGVAGVASQRVESGIHPDDGHSIRPVPIGLL